MATMSYCRPMSLRILTINLFNGQAECDSLAAALRDYEPDIVAAQELSANTASVLDGWAQNHLLDPRDDTMGMGVATNAAAEFSRLEFPNRRPVVAKVEAAVWGFDRGLELINAHLVNPVALPLRNSKRLRQLEAEALTALLQTEPEVSSRVLVGDLNSSPAWPLYRRLAAHATDAAVAAGTAQRSWGLTATSPRLLRIDHAFVQGARAVTTQLVEVRGSDHRGLLVDIEPVR